MAQHGDAPAPAGRRMRSWAWDYFVVLGWLLIVLLCFGPVTAAGWIDMSPVMARPVAGDLFVTALTVLPYLLYLVRTEVGPAHATWGKRRSGLVVARACGAAPSARSIVVRNVIKVLPWQLGHMAATRFALGTGTVTAVVADVLSIALLAAVAGPPLWRRRGVHDLLAGTAVHTAQ